MPTIQPPIDPLKLKTGSWGEYWLDPSTPTGKGFYYYDAPSVDINGSSETYNQNHGNWSESNSEYKGWWWSSDTDFTYKGINYTGQSIVVIDADKNSIYDSEIDFIIGYSFTSGSQGLSSGKWDRTSDFEGIVLGGSESFGSFKITVEMKYAGSIEDDTVIGSTKEDILRGGGGNDEIYGYESKDHLYGGNGNDDLNGGLGSDRLYGGNGNDILYGGLGNDRLVGGNGTDTAVFSSKNNRINLSSTRRQNTRDGRDILIGLENVNGGAGNDIITGNNYANTLNGESGKDTLNGGRGQDTLNGGNGNDKLNGGLGYDVLVGGNGTDTAVFSSKNNHINLALTRRQNTRDGRDILRSIENVDGGAGNDTITGNNSANTLYGGNGNDKLNGGADNDRLFGDAGKDLLIGGAGNDRLYGRDDNDRLFGEAGNDILFGGKGADTFNGGEGSDQYIGGNGADRFCINKGVGRDVIADYGTGNDQIKLLGGIKERNLTINQAGSDVRIKYEDDLLAIVKDTVAADINFI